MAESLAVVGTGLMGGSLGLAALACGAADRVVGYDRDPEAAASALARGAVTSVAASPAEAASEATLVVISTPVGVIADAYRELAPGLQPGALVTDLGSAKAQVVADIGPHVPAGTFFIGGHPLAGSEQEGIEAADPALFRGAFWFLTPTASTDPGAYSRLVRFLGSLDARVLSLEPGRHDELVALTSHLPQLLSSTLMGFASEISSAEGGLPLLAAGGFRDMTRIAASSPALWLDIVRANRSAILALLSRFQAALGTIAGFIEAGDWEGLRSALEAAQAGRAALPGKPGVAGLLIEIIVPVPDQPGVLAEVTTTMGEAGVNIEAFAVVTSPEGGRGRIHMAVSGPEAATAALEALQRRGYAPHRADPA